MKPFEQQYTAWLDGVLSPEEAAAFEREHPESAIEKARLIRIREDIRERLLAVPLPHADFFSSQISAQIAQEHRSRPHHFFGPAWLGLPRYAWGGAAAVALGTALFVTCIPHTHYLNPRAGYVADVLRTKTEDPHVTATVDKQKDLTIIKLEGLEKVPAEDDLSK